MCLRGREGLEPGEQGERGERARGESSRGSQVVQAWGRGENVEFDSE